MPTLTASKFRPVTQVLAAQSRRDGNGAIIRRAFPSPTLKRVDPFILLDHLGPAHLEHGRAGSELERRWEGFDAITYVIRGELEHEDATGLHTLGAGDVQWLTTGSGLVCAQSPSRSMRELGGTLHVLQLRMELSSRVKGAPPRYQTFPRSRLPVVSQSGVRITVVAGEAFGIRGPVETNTPTTYQVWSLAPGGAVTMPLPEDQHGFVYVIEGTVGVDGDGRAPRQLGEGHLALLGVGDALQLRGYVAPGQESLLLLAAGVPSERQS